MTSQCCCFVAAKDQSVSENWFDAAEDLVPPSQGAPRQDRAGVQRQGREESVTCAEERPTGDDRGPSYHLCVRNLSEDVTEEALMSLFQKYQATGVWFTNVGNNAKVAIVTVGSARGAETAVQEMNGRAVQGRAIKVDGINKPPVAMQGSSRASRPSPPCPAAAAAKPFIRNLAKRIVVQETPTSSGTFAPPHYATLGSFDRLMAQLSQRHPEASRHRIVAALQELRARKEGFLSGLPLRDILEMTSDLLRGQATASARV
ncbi:RNA-binding protein 44-like [Amia ocellicauda]|uniref:RNA-binding protein 44-like n=1 Tax=Amia ocellicauda TaxID=2972642 RepID=UPI00346391CC